MRRIVLLLMALLLPCALQAQDPNLQRGFAPGKAYDTAGLDSINTLNGNLNVQIPLGQVYSVGPVLQYQFVLAYNSKVWELEYIAGGNPAVIAVPETRSNAGMGWQLTFGNLLPPKVIAGGNPTQGWLYVAPDGSEHDFQVFMDVAVAETDDGSYLRLRRFPANTAQAVQYREIDFPNGVVHRFDPDGNLTEMRDRHGNWVKVDRLADQWLVRDGWGLDAARTHTVILENALNDAGNPYVQPNFRKRPIEVRLAAFAAVPASYFLSYDDVTLEVGGCSGSTQPIDQKFFAPLLNLVELPDGTTFDPSYLMTPADPCTSGTITELTLPTRGKIGWQHGHYELVNQSCTEFHPEVGPSGWRRSYAGVRLRTLKDESGNIVEKRVYTPWLQPRARAIQKCGDRNYDIEMPPEEFRNTVTVVVPNGASESTIEKTTHYFSAFPLEANPNLTTFAKGIEYGFPFFRGVSSDDRFLSTRTYLCGGGTCSDTVARTTYLKYFVAEGHNGYGPRPSEPRVEGRRTVFDDDSCGGSCRYYTDIASSDFDNYGHHRSSTFTSNIPGTRPKTTFTNYTPDSTNWLLNLYDTSWVKQGTGSTATATKTIAAFDTTNGFMKSLRILKATGPDPNALQPSSSDVMTVWCRDAISYAGMRGLVTSERSFGGDGGTIPGGDLCTVQRASGQYFINHLYTMSGLGLPIVGHRVQYDGTSHFVLEEEYEPKTGLMQLSKDSAGITTSYSYDNSGRMTSAKPHGRVEIHYDHAPTANPPRMTIREECPTGTGASPCTADSLTKSVMYFDDFGRVIEERRQFNDTEWSTTWTTYGPLGRRKSVTVPVSRSTENSEAQPAGVPATSWNYDSLGRVTLETRPDNSTSASIYIGARIIGRHVGQEHRSTETYDGAGRLTQVVQSPEPGAGDVVTSYSYDVGGRLTLVSMVAPDGRVQQRTFDYDGRGFLRWENQPETGMASYTYDSRGHLTAKDQSAANTQFDLRFVYDAAERLQTLSARNPHFGESGQTQFRLLKEFAYGTDNVTSPSDAVDLRKGKLVRAARYNYGPNVYDDVYRIEDTYRYGDASGRKTNRTTAIARLDSWGDFLVLKNVHMNVTYNALDLPQSIVYPHCLDCGAPSTAPDRSSMLYRYQRGRLDGITGFVDDVTYWPSGLRHELVHSNGRTDRQVVGGIPRPSSVAFVPTPVSRCLRPTFSSQPGSTTVPAGGGNATLTVVPSGTAPFEYEWVRESDGAVVGTTQSITVYVAANESFYVLVRNACGFEQSQTVKVTLGNCTPPTIEGIAAIRQPDGRWLLKPELTAQQPRTFGWRRLSDMTDIASTETVTVPAPGEATTYRLTLSDGCGTVTYEKTLTPAPGITQTELIATATSPTQIAVSWPAAFNVSHYVVERRSGATWHWLAETETPSYVDNAVIADRSYVYRAYAVRFGVKSDYSNSDVATTRSFSAAVSGQSLNVTPINGMLAAVNSVRAAVGWAAVTWGNILAPSDPLPQPSSLIIARHVTSARARMNEALSALGVPVREYANKILANAPIRAADVNEVQQRAQ